MPTGRDGQHTLGGVGLTLVDSTGFQGIRCEETPNVVTW